jgi:hypothetical protein
MKHFMPLLILIVLMSGCKKKEFENVYVEGNKPLPDNTIDPIKIESYYNRLYIELLGRKPINAEALSAAELLKDENFNQTNRTTLIAQIQQSNEYRQRTYTNIKANLLNQLDTAQITLFIGIFKNALGLPEYANSIDLINYEIARLKRLQNIPNALEGDTIDIIEIYRRSINNYFYDQLNMGTENFVVSTFQHFFDRYPAQQELDKGKKMVDGMSSDLFFEFGTSKNDYVQIIMRSDNFYEGQVRDLYRKYLFREPSTEEMFNECRFFKQDLNYKKLQQRILSADDYAIR